MLSFPITVAYAVLHGLLWLFGVAVMAICAWIVWKAVSLSVVSTYRYFAGGHYRLFSFLLWTFAALSAVQVIIWIL